MQGKHSREKMIIIETSRKFYYSRWTTKNWNRWILRVERIRRGRASSAKSSSAETSGLKVRGASNVGKKSRLTITLVSSGKWSIEKWEKEAKNKQKRGRTKT